MITSSQLTEIFQHQEQLAVKFHPIEIQNGYHPPAWPVDIQSREGQDRLRQFAWWIAEEITEALTAPHTDYPDEMADILHFSVEFCLMCGITADDVLLHHAPEIFDPAPEPRSLSDVFVELGKAVNLLKAKPWKQNPRPTDEILFRIIASLHLYYLLHCFQDDGLDPHTLYFKKKEVNEKRILTGV